MHLEMMMPLMTFHGGMLILMITHQTLYVVHRNKFSMVLTVFSHTSTILQNLWLPSTRLLPTFSRHLLHKHPSRPPDRHIKGPIAS